MGTVRRPRGIVRVNGISLPGFMSFEVSNNAYYEADTFKIALNTKSLPVSMSKTWFSQRSVDTFIEILAGFPANPDNPQPGELTSLIYGRIDDMDFNPARRSLNLTGRDLTGAFIDTKISQQYANQTASQIATTLAAAHGLQTNITSTTAQAGSYFESDTMLLAANRSEWDLLSILARNEGFVCYIAGQTLYFGPDDTGSGPALLVTFNDNGNAPVANFKDATFSRSQTVTKGVTVTVKSAGRGSKMVTESYPLAPRGTTPGKATPYGATTDYYYKAPAGWTPIQCKQRAQALYKQIVDHAMKCRVVMPADTTTNVQSRVTVSGTETSYDQDYFVKVVTRTMSMDDGFNMIVEAQSESPNLTPSES